MKEILQKLSAPLASLASSFFGMTLLSIIHYYTFHGTSEHQSVLFIPRDVPPTLIASFAASAVLIYGAYSAPLSQPKNLILGHLTGAIIGVTIKQLFMYANVDLLWLQSSLSVSLSIFMMEIINAVHPPGGDLKM
jgi:CBS-domain-containing membrane protein